MKLKPGEIVIFAMLGTIMYLSKMLMEILPNIHLLGTMVVATTIVYRKKALYPIYIYVFLNGLYAGFAMWWLPYTYIWTILWGMVMLLPKNMPKKVAPVVYIAVCALHGFLFGTFYSVAQALMFGLGIKGMIAWIVAGLPWDIIHGIGNIFAGFLIMPIVSVLRMAKKR
jgi:energy-coupling factor transport system substrate-specific component